MRARRQGRSKPEPTEPDNRDETSRQNLPMTSTDLVALAALLISCAAFLVAIADWLQLGREAPWEAAWGEDGIVVLTRRHYWPVWVEALVNFHGGGITVANGGVGLPVQAMHRNSTLTLHIGPGGRGSAIDVFYRRASLWEVLKIHFRPPLRNPHWTPDAMTGKHHWSTPVLSSGPRPNV